MGALILKAGIFSTIQDAGRYGYQDKGVSPTGAMDLRSYRIANLLVSNNEDAACVEVSYGGIKIKFTETMDIAVTGANSIITINDHICSMNKSLHIIAGDILEIGPALKGVYLYIAFSKDLSLKKVLGSYSTDVSSGIGGINGCKLKDGECLSFDQKASLSRVDRKSTEGIETKIESMPRIRFIEGCEYNRFSHSNQLKFESHPFTVSDKSDRMAYRLSNNPIRALDGNDILSQGLSIGTIQGTANGEVIVMLADRQTTGGYTRIGNIITADLGRFSQLTAGCQVQFEKVTLDEAHALLKDYQETFDSWKNLLKQAVEYTVLKKQQMHIHINGRAYNIEIQEVE